MLSALPSIIMILFFFLPVQYILAKKASAISYLATSAITKRIHLMSEILTTIKLIKFYAWEQYYQDKITKARTAEVSRMKRALEMKVLTFTVAFVSPVVATLFVLVLHLVLVGEQPLSAATTFTILNLFNTLRYPMLMLPNAVRSIAG